ncbi:MAG TPA: arsenite S-adenosylmethyltransferase [Elusimicrobia bacterium]|nr:arsenite S-adenosylmethyltransferase [Elusimicrobiota bacterium]
MKTSHARTRSMVRKAYGTVARKAVSCCSGSSCCGAPAPAKSEGELGLSCGDPVSFSKIRKGMTVLDLGSGAGKDVFIAAPMAGAKGKVIGVDMTPAMLALARKNAEKFSARTGLKNVEFRKGVIEKLPVKDGEADLIVSNCVINLSPDKPAVFREAFRALKPGGAIVVSDIVLNRELPPALKKHAGLYAACVAGALLRKDYLGAIKAAGFTGVKLLSDRLYSASGTCSDPITDKAGKALAGSASSITVYARRKK